MQQLTKMLRMYGSDGNDMEISITKLNVNHDEESQRQNRRDWQKYKPFAQETPYEQIQEIEVPTPLEFEGNDVQEIQILTIGQTELESQEKGDIE